LLALDYALKYKQQNYKMMRLARREQHLTVIITMELKLDV